MNLGLVILYLQHLFVPCIDFEYVHDIDVPQEESEAQGHWSTCIFEHDVDEQIKRHALVLIIQLLPVHAALNLLLPAKQIFCLT